MRCKFHLHPSLCLLMFFSSLPAPSAIYTLSLHDALPILVARDRDRVPERRVRGTPLEHVHDDLEGGLEWCATRSEEHTSELQSPDHLVCRLLLEKKKKENFRNRLTKHN